MILVMSLTGLFGLFVLSTKHRGTMHTYGFVFLMSVPLLFIHWLLFVLAFSCSAAHIFTDTIYSGTKRKIKKVFGFHSTSPEIIIKL